ncbi:MAG: hypothetical protein UR93_C0020G0006 [Berkelbacteria bacterium GW2011_GWA2_35_9]|uniref:Methyltransferase type 11 domain-containing protein n=1 Tax=Berkelbacteria bacterium GW2011_GWA2_35_9 TaxID=1618333 RepID=A0A0G0D4I6_9BACT|nr:MAG: hypothetical protein UR93_C0020G0006 [Berkelbacteria bacterium GW2011_GWA2_35_9]
MQDFEILEKKQIERWGKNATEDLLRLGLEWEQLDNKSTLDVGAGPALIGESAKLKGLEVMSIDNNPKSWKKEDNVEIPKVPYIIADAEKLPFPNETFDLVISHAGPFVNTYTKESLIKMISEAQRVLKNNGELRFGPGNLNANIFTDEELFTPEEEIFSISERVERIKEKSLQFLKSIDQNFEQIIDKDNKLYDPKCLGYYKLIKK